MSTHTRRSDSVKCCTVRHSATTVMTMSKQGVTKAWSPPIVYLMRPRISPSRSVRFRFLAAPFFRLTICPSIDRPITKATKQSTNQRTNQSTNLWCGGVADGKKAIIYVLFSCWIALDGLTTIYDSKSRAGCTLAANKCTRLLRECFGALSCVAEMKETDI